MNIYYFYEGISVSIPNYLDVNSDQITCIHEVFHPSFFVLLITAFVCIVNTGSLITFLLLPSTVLLLYFQADGMSITYTAHLFFRLKNTRSCIWVPMHDDQSQWYSWERTKVDADDLLSPRTCFQPAFLNRQDKNIKKHWGGGQIWSLDNRTNWVNCSIINTSKWNAYFSQF